MAESLEFQAKFLVVVDFAVVHHVVAAIGCAHRLPSRIAGIDDGETAMQQQHLGLDLGNCPFSTKFHVATGKTQPAQVVGPAMLKALQHCARARRFALTGWGYETCNSTHD